jgi:hypothetical protein
MRIESNVFGKRFRQVNKSSYGAADDRRRKRFSIAF